MLKIAVIIVLLLLAIMASKYLEERAQKKLLIGLGALICAAIVILMASELLR